MDLKKNIPISATFLKGNAKGYTSGNFLRSLARFFGERLHEVEVGS